MIRKGKRKAGHKKALTGQLLVLLLLLFSGVSCTPTSAVHQSISYQIALKDIDDPVFDAQTNSLLYLRVTGIYKHPDAPPMPNSGYLTRLYLQDNREELLYPDEVRYVGEENGTIGVSWSPSRSRALIDLYDHASIFNLGTQSFTTCPTNARFLGWWKENPLFFVKSKETIRHILTKISLVVNRGVIWEPEELFHWEPDPPGLPLREPYGINFVMGDRLILELPSKPGDSTKVEWMAVNLESGTLENLSGMPQTVVYGALFTPPPTLPGPNDQIVLLQDEANQRIWLWQNGQLPQLILTGYTIRSLVWIDSQHFLFLSSPWSDESKVAYWNGVWLAALGSNQAVVTKLGDLSFSDFLVSPIVSKDLKTLWCLATSSLEFLELKLPFLDIQPSAYSP